VSAGGLPIARARETATVWLSRAQADTGWPVSDRPRRRGRDSLASCRMLCGARRSSARPKNAVWPYYHMAIRP